MKDTVEKQVCPKCGAVSGAGGGFCGNCGTFLNIAQWPVLALPAGHVVSGRYAIVGILGVGGFGIIYEAMDNQTRSVCAVKEYVPVAFVEKARGSSLELSVLKERQEDFEFARSRFRLEGEVLLKLSDVPGIVKGFGAFNENNTSYIVMERLDGRSVKRACQELDQSARCRCARQMLETIGNAVAEVHRRGILHRDISPDNIFQSKKGEYCLIDFGSFRDISSADDNMQTITLKHGYAPPEQYTFKDDAQGPWTDVYALCATFYYIVTGEKLEDARARRSDDRELIKQRLACLNSQRQTLAIAKGLETDTAARYSNVPRLLEDFGVGRPAQTAPAPGQEPFKKIFGKLHELVDKGIDASRSSLEKYSQPKPLRPAIELCELGALIPMETDRIYNVGRISPETEIVASYSGMVSRCHCKVLFESRSGQFKVMDTSENGTFGENGVRLQRGMEYQMSGGSTLYLAAKVSAIRLVIL